MNLQELLDIADRTVGTLAVYDLEVRGLDLPGVPDSVWADLTTLCGALSRAVEETDLEYHELDFTDEEYAWNYVEQESDEQEDKDADSESD